jgi:hypothetical protein
LYVQFRHRFSGGRGGAHPRKWYIFWFDIWLFLLLNGSFQKRSILPPRRKFLPSGGGGDDNNIVSDNNKCIPKGVGGLTSYFLRGGGMDVFWNDPIRKITNIMDSDLAMQAEKTNFVKLFPWPFRVLPPEAPAKASSSTPPRYLSRCSRTKIWKSVSGSVSKDVAWYCVLPPRKECVIVE